MLRHAKLSISIWPLQVGVWPYTSCHAWRLAARTAPWRSRGRLRRRDKPSRHRPATVPPPSRHCPATIPQTSQKRWNANHPATIPKASRNKDGTQTAPPPSLKHLTKSWNANRPATVPPLPRHHPSNISKKLEREPSRHHPATVPGLSGLPGPSRTTW